MLYVGKSIDGYWFLQKKQISYMYGNDDAIWIGKK